MLTSSPSARVEEATQVLAADAASALAAPGRAFTLQRRVAELDDSGTGLGAVRVLGADILAPYVLCDRVPGDDDIAVVREAARAYPAPPVSPTPDLVWAARDWALRRVLARFAVDATTWEGLSPAAAVDSDSGEGIAASIDERWPAWSVAYARLSPLALPGLVGATRNEAGRRRADLSRGMVRSMLRRDHLTAARLARWLALDHSTAPEPLLTPALEHMAMLATGEPRTALELTIAHLLKEPKR
ncbi:hypothetical protein CDO52_17215 [Nocardiopsis gilva YIM 90087]|uniref:Uncharacterized protein n=1 Tax=Nocardiopsis gilva YIM 90087 TaxID=1235441 RepID=A0A223S860_9ACTN|nr:hypothetical protein [Nocardiopsis gilva]ASU84303.1 hypothetical protein CDO52_17215 [Nocardiopsis gilva YIM 90087]